MSLKALIVNSLLTVILFTGNYLTQVIAQPDTCISELHFAEINEISLHYIECGEREPLVLVHGTLGDYRVWLDQVHLLSQNYRVISYSRRYHYPNPWPQDASDFTVNIHAKDLADFIQHLDLVKVHLIGHSYGALTALIAARDHPGLVRSLNLGEPPAMSFLTISSHDLKIQEPPVFGETVLRFLDQI